MHAFRYVEARDAGHAFIALRDQGAMPLAGGTTLVDLMRLGTLNPEVLVDLRQLPWHEIDVSTQGLRLGALAANADVAAHPAVQREWPVIANALLSGASPQVRNMASIAGNLLQSTRCPYYRNPEYACNRRTPDTGCAARSGIHREHAVFGTNSQCIAVHPSDLAVALVALDAEVELESAQGNRRMPLSEFYRLPGDNPQRETELAPGELVRAVHVPRLPGRTHYLKTRDRASFQFALVSAAVALHVEQGVIRRARIVLGGVAACPWRARAAEAGLQGFAPSGPVFEHAARQALEGAQGLRDNAFKIPLARAVIVRALQTVAAEGPARAL